MQRYTKEDADGKVQLCEGVSRACVAERLAQFERLYLRLEEEQLALTEALARLRAQGKKNRRDSGS